MAGKLIFKHGVMESGKSAELLMKAYLFREKGKRVVVIKPTQDIREPQGTLSSRVGISSPCLAISPENDLQATLRHYGYLSDTDVILVDEAQFLQEYQVEALARIVDSWGCLCIAYGLKCDFSGHLFPATRRFIELADRIDEAPSMCKCGKKATMHYRRVASTEQILCGDTDIYESVCRPCYMKLTGDY
ncbi:thymidine kinase [Vibrio phage CHOED]|uniref:thymidine kinase n=1 Tax=Vibrio phage CHOED TaxID=1458716 RepID=UPI00042E60E1|nr:thymidine kinase [Vibrio phage CHOED]AHK11886.1 thymidine kinase [Vibrio phage CHOED]